MLFINLFLSKNLKIGFEFNQFQGPENNSVIRASDLLMALIQELDGFIFSQNADV